MSTQVSDAVVADAPPRPPKRRRLRTILFAVLGVAAAVVIVLGVLFVRELSRDVPKFPSLAANPDSSLQGTVAYYSDSTRCVRVVAAAGSPSKDVLCLADMDVSMAMKLGKEQGPQLVWLPDNRLEVTMFRMTDPPGPNFNPGWQKIVDVRTGKVEDVPAAQVPSQANRTTHPAVNAAGDRISWTSNAQTGRVKVVLHDKNGTRTLLSAQGPPNYTYGLTAAFWAPDGKWIAADDGRILVITPAEPPVTRVLTDETTQAGFDGELSRFAVTSANLLTASG